MCLRCPPCARWSCVVFVCSMAWPSFDLMESHAMCRRALNVRARFTRRLPYALCWCARMQELSALLVTIRAFTCTHTHITYTCTTRACSMVFGLLYDRVHKCAISLARNSQRKSDTIGVCGAVPRLVALFCSVPQSEMLPSFTKLP